MINGKDQSECDGHLFQSNAQMFCSSETEKSARGWPHDQSSTSKWVAKCHCVSVRLPYERWIVLYCPLYASYTYNLNRAIHKWRKHTAYPELLYWPTFSTLNVWQAHPHTCKHAVASVIRLSCNGIDRAWHSSPSEKLKMKNFSWITGEVHLKILSLIPFQLSFIWQIQSKSPLSRMVLSCWPR